MYCCQRCDRDVTAEVDAEISNIVNGPTPGQLFGGFGDYFEKRYVCLACNERDRAATTTPGSKKKKIE